ncbi:MAG: signal peptidase II [Pseudomonadota bacterium]
MEQPMRLVCVVAFFAFAIDQVSKYLVVYGLNLIEKREIDVLPPLLNFKMGWNTGINFGIFSGASPVVWILIAFGIVGFVLWWVFKDPQGKWQLISAGLLVGGALGNVIDRMIYGAVADFLNMSCCGFTNPTVFNIADIFIFAGAIGLVIFTKDKEKKAA